MDFLFFVFVIRRRLMTFLPEENIINDCRYETNKWQPRPRSRRPALKVHRNKSPRCRFNGGGGAEPLMEELSLNGGLGN